MALVCLLSALHSLRSALIAPDILKFGDDVKIELDFDAGARLEVYVKHNATPQMASCLMQLFTEYDGKRSLTIEGVTFTYPVRRERKSNPFCL